MTIAIRPLLEGFEDRESAVRALLDVDESAFGESMSAIEMDSPELAVLEDDRTLLAWDGDQVVGASSVYSLDLSIPGGSTPAAGVTWLSVRPSHRRQGIMRTMLEALHQQSPERDEPLAALWAAQAPIYQRFGYGVASRLMRTVIPREAGQLYQAPFDPSLRLSMVPPADDRELTQPVYDTMRARHPGFPSVNGTWHRRLVDDPADQRGGASPLTTVVVTDDTGPRGFVRYSLKPSWADGFADGTVQVRHMLALDAAASAALWRFAIDFDLAGRVEAWNTRADDPIQHWLEEPRRGTRQLQDQLYVKLLDVGTALSRRSYAVPVDVVIEVDDANTPANTGRWRLSGDATGAMCERTNAAPDLAAGARTLGAVYLGGPTLLDHQAAGWVDERTPGAVAAASAAFAHHPAPYSPFVF